MSADNELDLSVLTWVKGELDITLGQARQALEAFVEDPEDTGQLGFCVAYIHQVYGTLQMLELYGASMLAEEMEALAQALQDKPATRREETFEVLMRAMLQLPDYLERLQAGQRDVPLALLPLVNDLRAARGLNLLSENALFTPDMSGLVTLKAAEKQRAGAGETLANLARRLRPGYQKALLGWLRTQKQKQSLAEMSTVIVALEHAATLGPVVQLWWVAGGLFEALAEGGLKSSVSLNQVLGQIDREIKRLIDEGELALAEHPSTELLKNLLYYLAQADSTGERVVAVQDAFKLSEALPAAEEVEAARVRMTGHNISLMQTVGQALKEDLSGIKDGLDLFVRSDQRDPGSLSVQAERLKRVADTLGMLGLGVQRQLVQEKAVQIAAMSAGERQADDAAIMDIAQTLLVVESALDGLSTVMDEGREEAPAEAGGMQLPAAEFEQVRLAAAREALVDIRQAQNDIMAFIDTPWGHEQLAALPAIIQRVRGSLQMLGLERVAGILRAVANYTNHELIENKLIPEPQALDNLADAISAVEYYLEALVERNRLPVSVLELAARSAQALGYAPMTESLGPAIGFNEPAALASMQASGKVSVSVSEELGDEILQIFIEEAEEELGNIRELLPRWKEDLENEEPLSRMRRSFHTLKGSGRLVGASEVGEFAWAFEKLLNRVLEHTLQPDGTVLALLDEALEALPELLEQMQAGVEPSIDIAALEARAHAAAEPGKAPPAVVAAKAPIVLDPTLADIFIKESHGHLAELKALIEKCRGATAPCLVSEQVVRALHTLHGSARMAGVDEVAELGNALEKCIKDVMTQERPLDADILKLMDAACTALRATLATINVPGASLPDIAPIQKDIAAYHAALHAAPAAESEAAADVEEDDELLQIFLEEGADILDSSEHLLQQWKAEPAALALAGQLQRDLHTLKGSARMTGLTVIGDTSHVLESLLAAIAEGRRDSSPQALDVLQRSLDTLHGLLEQARERQPLVTPQALLDELEAVQRGELPVEEIVIEAPAETVMAEAASAADDSDEAFDAELREIFLEEGGEILEDSEQILQRWREAPHDKSIVARLQRELHTMKGSARMAGLTVVGDFSHALESLLAAIAEGRRLPTRSAIELLQRSLDRLHGLLEQAAKLQPLSEPSDLLEALEQLPDTDEAVVAAPEVAAPVVTATPVVEAVAEPVVEPVVEPEAPAEVVASTAAEAEETPAEQPAAAKTEPFEPLTATPVETAEPVAETPVVAAVAEVPAVETAVETTLETTFETTLETAVETPAIEAPVAEVEAVETLPEPVEAAAPEAEAELEAAAAVETAVVAAVAVETEAETAAAGARTGQETMRVRTDLIDDLVNYAGEVSIYRSRLQQQVGSFAYNLVELDQTVVRLREQLRKLELETEAQILHRFEETRSEYDAEFDPLEMDRYSQIQQLSRALNESANDLVSLQNLLESTTSEAETLLLQQSRVNTELQEGLMRSRMVPFTGLATRLRRLVRQTADTLHKKVEFEVYGAEGEMDRKILDRITAPLEHMLRNAVSHGIDSPAERKAAGKPATGQIELRLSREGSEVVLNISDDGQGIDIEAIRRIAVDRGLLAANAAANDQDIMLFILESGFSTAKEITQVSGRGVGMDVVNSEVKQLGGSLAIVSAKGQGTTFTIRLPLTLAVNRALLVHAGEDNYAIPLTSIEGVVRMEGAELQALLDDGDGRYHYNEHAYRVYRLGDLLAGHLQPLDGKRRHPVLLVRYGDQRAAIQVDGLLGSREIVVKSIGAQLSTVPGLSGATILGDGSVVLILDVGALLHHGLSRSWVVEAEQEEAVSDETTVMVVDDSITIRKVTSRLLERNGMRVLTAKDGVDAVALLQEHRPDVFLLDIEMPRMDGYELATHIRNDARLKHIPIIMITSRTGEKHRQRAFAIGVNRYLGKPYTESELMQNVRDVLAMEDASEPA